MPGNTESLWYSFNMGPIHFISLNTEVYYFLNYGLKSLVSQYEWLENDLIEANLPENRLRRPWIVVMGHRPMYCSNDGDGDCTHYETLTRVGLPFLHYFGLEKLLYDYGADVLVWAHEHSYERLWPLYDYNVYNGSYLEPYRNPGAPVHIITGSAGCNEGHTDFKNGTDVPAWSAFRNMDYGYTKLKAFNKTHLYIEQISDEKAGAVIDSFWIVKDTHGSYPLSDIHLDDEKYLRNKLKH